MDLREKLTKSSEPKTTTAIEKVPRLKPEIINILNEQITNEFRSAQIYFAISACLDDKGWNNAGKLFLKYGHEEMTHMKKVQEYLYDRNCKAVITGLPEVEAEYGSIKEALTTALEHEIGVTANWQAIACAAKDAKDTTTFMFTDWFLAEQVEEENKFRDLLDLINLGIPDWELEHRIGEMLE
jgi:ferritin